MAKKATTWHVVLDDIADRPGGVIKVTSSFDPELLRHCDLHTLDVIPVPDRLQKAIGEAKEQKIENRFFTEVVVDPKDSRFRKHRVKCSVQQLSRGKVVSKGLLDDDSCIFYAVRFGERVDDTRKRLGGIAR
jgi:hypothetical protein